MTVNLAIDAAVDVGSDGSGVDVIFYSTTAGDNVTWDASDKSLEFTDSTISLDGATAGSWTDANIVVSNTVFN